MAIEQETLFLVSVLGTLGGSYKQSNKREVPHPMDKGAQKRMIEVFTRLADITSNGRALSDAQRKMIEEAYSQACQHYKRQTPENIKNYSPDIWHVLSKIGEKFGFKEPSEAVQA